MEIEITETNNILQITENETTIEVIQENISIIDVDDSGQASPVFTGDVMVISTRSSPPLGFTIAYNSENKYGGIYADASDNSINIVSKYPNNNGPIRFVFEDGAYGTTGVALMALSSADHPIVSSGSQAGKTIFGGARRLLLKDSDASQNNRIEIGFGWDSAYQPVVIGHKVTDYAGQSSGTFYVGVRPNNTNTAPLEVLTILPGGNVGIGDPNPGELLDVAGNINATGTIKIDDVQVVSNRVMDSRIDDAINESVWDSTTAGVLDAIRDAMINHGLMAASA